MKISEEIQNKMIELGLDRKGFAARVRISPRTLDKWASGISKPSEEKMDELRKLQPSASMIVTHDMVVCRIPRSMISGSFLREGRILKYLEKAIKAASAP